MTDELHAKRPPFVQIPLSWATALRSVDIHVALVLGGYAGHHGGRAWPSIATLARDTGLSENTVRAALTRLQTSKVLTVEHRKHPNGRDRSNAYVIDLTGAGLGEGAKSEPMGAESEPSPEGMGAKSEPIEGANFAPTEGAKFEDDLDQEKIQIHVDTDPHTPPTPSCPDPCVRVEESPAAQSEPAEPLTHFDPVALRYTRLAWEVKIHQPDPGFIDYVVTTLPKKENPHEAKAAADGFVRNARTSETTFHKIAARWEAYHAQQQQQQAQATDEDIYAAIAARRRRTGF